MMVHEQRLQAKSEAAQGLFEGGRVQEAAPALAEAEERTNTQSQASDAGLSPVQRTVAPLVSHWSENSDQAVQRAGGAAVTDDQVHEAAKKGTSDSGSALPYLGQIQMAFGPSHDLSNVKAHTGENATQAARAMGAEAYTSGDHVAFAGSPSLHTVAHEAAHVVQQRAGVALQGGVGKAGDEYERNAEAVADRVVQGKSAEDLLGGPGQSPGKGAKVQMLGTPLNQPLPAGSEAPAHGADKDQRRYSVEQYIAMWEAEQGRKMTEAEKATIARGCIGITAMNLSGGGNPPLNQAYATFEQAHEAMVRMNEALDGLRAKPETAAQAQGKHAVLFAKLFWSNQDPDPEKRKTPDEDAYKPDPVTGKVDMSTYRYRAQPGYINFDYGFWDEASQCFWHANHAQPGMKVYQSTKERFSRGYIDFDRIIFCVAIATNYDPGLAAISHARGG